MGANNSQVDIAAIQSQERIAMEQLELKKMALEHQTKLREADQQLEQLREKNRHEEEMRAQEAQEKQNALDAAAQQQMLDQMEKSDDNFYAYMNKQLDSENSLNHRAADRMDKRQEQDFRNEDNRYALARSEQEGLQDVRNIIWPNQPDRHYPVANRQEFGKTLDELQAVSTARQSVLDKFTHDRSLDARDIAQASADPVLSMYLGQVAGAQATQASPLFGGMAQAQHRAVYF